MVRRLAIIFLSVFILHVTVFAGEGGYRSPFAVGFGARQLGMGGATVANVNTSSSIFWNPAGLAKVDRSEVQLFHMTLFMDTRYDFVAMAYPTLSLGTFGAGIGDLASSDFDRVEDFVTIGTFSSRQDLFMVGYGFPLFEGLYTGMTVKGVYYDIAGYRDSGFGFDLGLIYSLGFLKDFSLGLKGTDIGGPSIKLNTLEQRYPWSIRGGLAYENLLSDKHSLLVNVDIENTEKLGSDIYAGGEFGLSQLIFVRIGYMGDKLTIGAGISYAGINFDYAYASMSDLETSHRLSLSYVFGASVAEKRDARNREIAEVQINEFKNRQENDRQDRLSRELARARKHEEDNEIYDAVNAYYRVLALDSQNEEALNKVSVLFDRIRQDIVLEASKGYTNQLVQSQLDLADTYFKNKQYENAEEQYNLALLLDSENQHAKDRLAQIEQNRLDEINRLQNQVQAQIDQGNYDAALQALSRIMAINPDDRRAIAGRNRIVNIVESSRYLNRALQYFDRADYEKSIALADSALMSNPDSEGAKSLKRQLARFTAKVTTLEDIKKNDEHWQIYLQGMDKYQAGDYKEAIRLWQSLQEYYPNNPNLKRNIDQAAERSINQ